MAGAHPILQHTKGTGKTSEKPPKNKLGQEAGTETQRYRDTETRRHGDRHCQTHTHTHSFTHKAVGRCGCPTTYPSSKPLRFFRAFMSRRVFAVKHKSMSVLCCFRHLFTLASKTCHSNMEQTSINATEMAQKVSIPKSESKRQSHTHTHMYSHTPLPSHFGTHGKPRLTLHRRGWGVPQRGHSALLPLSSDANGKESAHKHTSAMKRQIQGKRQVRYSNTRQQQVVANKAMQATRGQTSWRTRTRTLVLKNL